MKKGISRRDFLRGAAASAASMAAMGLMGACASDTTATTAGTTAASEPAATNASTAAATSAETQTDETQPAETQPAPAAAPSSDWLGAAPDIAESDISETWETDLLIVGAGNGGMMAAVKAADLGMNFRIIEQSTAMCETRHWYGAVNSSECLAAGLTVDTKKLLGEASRYASGKLDQRVLKVWINESAAMHDYVKPLMEAAGCVCSFETDTGEDEIGTQYYRPPIQHTYAAAGSAFGGSDRNQVFKEHIESKGYWVDFQYALVKLEQDASGNVTGVIAQNTRTSSYIRIQTQAVILACGGYEGNPDMMEKLSPLATAVTTACSFYPANQGMGIKAALWAGAAMDAESAPMLFDRGIVAPGVDAGYVLDASGNRVFPGTVGQYNPGTQPFLKVNRKGERFANESCPYNDIVFAAYNQPGHVYAQIHDSNFDEDVQRFHTLGCSALTRMMGNFMKDSMIEAGLLMEADTLEELADKMGFAGADKETFLATVNRYNELYDNQDDEDFGKDPSRLSAIRKAPFYGCWLGASLLCTGDGIKINPDMQAMTPACEPIGGLYVIGNNSGSFFANNYPELVPGMACGRTLTFALHAVGHAYDHITPTERTVTENPAAAYDGPTSAEGLKDGTYTATAKGFASDITVEVTIQDGKITACTADVSGESADRGMVNGPLVVEQILAKNGTAEIDAVSGSTITRDAIIQAVNDCLAQAK